MKTLFRFNVCNPVMAVEMPEGAVVRSFGVTSKGPCFWAEVDPEAPKVRKVFAMVRTGKPIPEAATGFVGTCHLPHTTAVHLYAMPDDFEIPLAAGSSDPEDSEDEGSEDEDENNS